MQQERARLQLQQQVFRTAPGVEDHLSRYQVREVFLYAPTQPLLVEAKLHDPMADRVGLDPAAGGFNFGQLRHLKVRLLGWDRQQKGPAMPGPLKISSPRRGVGYLILVSLYATCLRTTGSNLRTSILSGCRRLFLVVT